MQKINGIAYSSKGSSWAMQLSRIFLRLGNERKIWQKSKNKFTFFL